LLELSFGSVEREREREIERSSQTDHRQRVVLFVGETTTPHSAAVERIIRERPSSSLVVKRVEVFVLAWCPVAVREKITQGEGSTAHVWFLIFSLSKKKKKKLSGGEGKSEII